MGTFETPGLDTNAVVASSNGAPKCYVLGELRQRRADHAFRTGLIARSFSIAANFATVPLALAALGSSGFGVWSAITSTLALMAFLDFGIGNGAMGHVTEALARDDQDEVRSILRNAYALLGAIAVIFAATAAALYASGYLGLIADASGSFLAGHLKLTVWFVIGYAFVIPVSFVQRLLFAYQRAGQATLLQVAFSILYLLVAIAAWHWEMGLASFVVGYVVTMFVVYGAGTVIFLSTIAPTGVFSEPVQPKVMRRLLHDAGVFFLLQATVAIVYNSDQLILSSFATPDEVAVYATALKVFSIVILFNGLLISPLWPAFSDARARNDWAWIREAYYKSRRRSLALSVTLAVALVVFGAPLVLAWTGGRIHVPMLLLAGMALWVVLEGYGQCMAVLLNAARVIRLQLVIALLLLTLGTALKIYLSTPLGIYGPLLGTIVTFTLVVALYETHYIHKLLAFHK